MTAPSKSVVIACLVSIALGYGAGRWMQSHATTDDAAAAKSTSEESVPKPSQRPRAASVVSKMDARSTDAFATRYDALAKRAESGDLDASRELTRTLAECARIPADEQYVASMQMMMDRDSLMGQSWAARPGALAQFHERVEKELAHLADAHAKCDGITQSQLRSRGRWLYQAGMRGDAQSALEFGRGDFVHTVFSMDALDDIPFWRDHAEDMLLRALAGGEARAALALAQGHDPNREDGDVQTLPLEDDALMAYAYYCVMRMSSDFGGDYPTDAMRRLAAALSEADRQDAERRAAEICATDLGGRCHSMSSIDPEPPIAAPPSRP